MSERRPATGLGEPMLSGPGIIETPHAVSGWTRRTRRQSSNDQLDTEVSDELDRVRIREYRQDGRLGRGDDLPAVETIDENGRLRAEEWYRNGLLHRDGDRPAVKTYDQDGQLHSGRRYQNGAPLPQPSRLQPGW